MDASRANFSWKSDFLQSLSARDAREQAHAEIITAYTALAARLLTNPSGGSTTPTQSTPSDDQLRTDLQKSQALASTLTSEVTSLRSRLAALTSATTQNTTQITSLTTDLAAANRRIKDLQEECQVVRKLYQDCQDEMLAQGIMVEMAEQEKEKLRLENEGLVRRLLERKGREVEEMNKAFEPVDLH
ncbi:autophagy protein 16 [Ascobolus immersus RN42]|uniref:Autophagy protein 16 n=1 Tax=Ascobolus immersus RN42 TaxID=1160509 RepID=A0A3N4HMM9_ASCIM|nr:autophagy protein 16 [Ascobolus immersus RN42]